MAGAMIVVANPANRRFELFQAVAEAAGIVVAPWSWLEVLQGRPPPAVPARWLRLDSPGEDAAVLELLVGSDVALFEVGPLATWYRSFTEAASRAVAVATAAVPGIEVLNPVEDLRLLFDKTACHRHLAAAGIPVPPALSPVGGYAELRQAMAERRWPRVFVKPRHGSSACGVVALTAAGRRLSAITSTVLEGDPPRLRNRLGLRQLTDPTEVAAIVDRLAVDGVHVEQWYPKLGVGGRIVDLRIVVVAGEPTHAVVRAARGPITNLHLGNERGDLGALIESIGHQQWESALATCQAVAIQFPRSLHLGVDVLLAASGRGHVVAEVNAFGDLLPGVTHQGRSTYEEEVDALLAGRHGARLHTARPAAEALP